MNIWNKQVARVNEMEQIDYLELREEYKTGNIYLESKSIIYPFDKYEVEVKLAPDGKFLGITGISINKDFLSYTQRLNSYGYIDLDKYYSEDDEETPE